jgi:hypothetical protein
MVIEPFAFGRGADACHFPVLDLWKAELTGRANDGER